MIRTRGFGFQNRGRFILVALVASLSISSVSAAQIILAECRSSKPNIFAAALDRPQTVVPLVGSKVLVAERSGKILLVDSRGPVDLGSVAIHDAPVFYVKDQPFTEGLKDVIPIPGQERDFIWCMNTGSAAAIRWTVGRMTLDLSSARASMQRNEIVWQSDPQPWVRSNPPPFSGCKMVVDGADVVVAMGANSRATGVGRIMRISLSKAHQPQVVSTGHRNPSGVIFRSGKLWEVEHGPEGGDELDLIEAGGDYGWHAVSSGQPDDHEHASFLSSRPNSVDPRGPLPSRRRA